MFGLWTNIQLLLDYGPHFIWFLVQLANNGWQSSYGWSYDLKPAISGKLSTLFLDSPPSPIGQIDRMQIQKNSGNEDEEQESDGCRTLTDPSQGGKELE